MLDFTTLKPHKSRKKKKVGRGTSSGHGKTCCRGHKGQKSRAGGTKGKRFEGGQTPLYRRLPKKRGFNNDLFRVSYTALNVGKLEMFDDSAGIQEFVAAGFMKPTDKVKVLGGGKLTKALTVTANAFSKSAKEMIEKAGGKAQTC